MTKKTFAIWLLAAATLAVYLTMIFWTLPYISSEAGGLWVFDLRSTGYTHTEAVAFLTALSDAGREMYRTTQFYLDAVFPPLLGLLVIVLAFKLSRHTTLSLWVYAHVFNLTMIAAVAGCVFDWLENAAVQDMLVRVPATVTELAVDQASFWTQLKAGSVTISFLCLIVLAIARFIKRDRRQA